MGTSVTLGGVSYTIPAIGEAYGQSFTNYLIAIASDALTTDGGAFTLLADADFGGNFGLKSIYYKSRGTTSTAGVLRLGNTETVGWRDAGNTADLELTVNSSDILEFNGNPITTLALGAAETVLTMNAGGTATEYALIDNANVDASAAIAYSKLNLSTSIVNADVSASAAIAYSKLNLTGLIVSADLAGSIDATKIADGSVTSTEFQYINSLTSNAQTQLTARVVGPGSSTDNAVARYDTTTGVLLQDSSVTISDTDDIAGVTSLTAGGAIDSSAIIDMTSTTQGLGLPNLTTTQRDAISTPKTGLTIFNTTTSALNVYDSGAWTEAGGGAGEINYILNPDAEAGTTGWATYDDGASATPVDGTGGTASNLTLTSQATTILRGNFSFKLAKGAADAQGEGASYDFVIPKADEQKKLKIEFDYNTDGTYADDDLTIYIYDVTNASLITPSVTGITGWDKDNNGSGKALISFDSTDSNSYRLIFHVATTSASAYDFYFDNVIVGPGSIVTGAAVGPTIDYSSEVDSTVTASYTRDGEYMIINWKQIPTGVDTFENVVLPSGFTIDTGVTSTSTNNYSLGSGSFLDSGVAIYSARVAYLTTTTLHPRYDNGTSLADIPALISGDDISLIIRVPIAEWAGAGTVNMLNDDVLNNNARFAATGLSGARTCATGVHQNIDLWDNYELSGGSFDGEFYTVPADGWYQLNAQMRWSNAITATTIISRFVKNGSTGLGLNVYDLAAAGEPSIGSSYLGKFVTGDTIAVSAYQASGGTESISGTDEQTNFSIQRISDYTATQTGIGFGLATSTESGLVSATTQTFAGDKTFTGSIKLQETVGQVTTFNLTGNGQTVEISSCTIAKIQGNGSARTGIILGTTGAVEGQIVHIIDKSWNVSIIDSSTATLGGGAITIGGTAAVPGFSVVFDGATWVEVGRSPVV